MTSAAAHSAPRRPPGLHRIAHVLSAALFLAVVSIGVAAVVVPALSGSVALAVLSGSMEPGLPVGSTVVVRPVETDSLGIGDVITYQLRSGDPTVVTHRIIGVGETADGRRSFATKGDANADADAEPVRDEQVRGEVWYSIPFVGFMSTALSADARAWLIPSAGVFLLAYAGYCFAGSVTARRRKAASVRRATNAASPPATRG